MADNPLAIGDLSAYDLYKVQQSYDAYQKSQQKIPFSGESRHNPNNAGGLIKKREEQKKREGFKRGSYGIEDEYRYMLSIGFEPEGTAPAPAASMEKPEIMSLPEDVATSEAPAAAPVEAEVEEPDVTNLRINRNPVTIKNPRKNNIRGGISQFGASTRSGSYLPTIKSKLLNV